MEGQLTLGASSVLEIDSEKFLKKITKIFKSPESTAQTIFYKIRL